MRARLTTTKVFDAIKALPAHSCAGEDSITMDFFKNYWEVIEQQLCGAFQEILDTGQLPLEFGEGLIYLIPKAQGPTDEIKKWRPIILTIVYKILAKVLTARIEPLLPQIIHTSQAGFIKEWSILDNIFTFWEATTQTIKTKKNLEILLLDFEKAYDKVDWEFL